MLLLVMAACGCGSHLWAGPGRGEARDVPTSPFSALPQCRDTKGDGRLDLLAGCAAQTYDQWVAALGEPECDPPDEGDDIECRWGGLASGSWLATEVEFDDPELELEDGDEGDPVDGLADELVVMAPE